MNYYDRDGSPMGVLEWARAFEDDQSKRVVARTKVASAVDPSSKSFDVSTVWLGIDHNFFGGPPLIFETMVFGEGSADDLDCERYSTEQQAREGHTAMVAKVAATLDDPIVVDGPS